MRNLQKTLKPNAIKKLPLIMAFVIPVLILLILYIGREVFPFGENMYLRSDMYHQYAPFVKEFQRNLQHGGSLLYSWNIGLGNNFASTYAYYLASPVNWLVGLFPDTLVPEFMNLMLILKAGLMSAAFTWYLVRKFHRSDYIATVFGCFYAMSSYMAAFSWNVMWLDCLVLFPLILIGLEKLIREKKPAMYVITLAVCIISNYYISIMIAIFLVVYYVYYLVCEQHWNNGSEVLYSICMFLITSVIAGCMAMFIVLPALFNLFLTASSDSAFPGSFTAYYNLLEMLSKSVINTEPAVFSGHFPNIYATMGLFIFVPLYWISKRVPVKEKAGKTILLCILAFSFMFNVPTYIWHGFHFPNSLPCRYSFIFIFLSLVMGYQALLYIRRYRPSEIVICSAVGIGAVFLFQALFPEEGPSLGNASAGAAFILAYMIIALLLNYRKVYRTAVVVFLLIAVIAEIIINTNETGYSITSRTVYVSDNEAIRQMLSEVDDGSFYRVEKVTRKTKNDGTWNDYRSVSVFSSTTVSGNSDLYDDLGMQGRVNAYSYSGHTPVTQALLGVRYEIAETEQKDPLMTEAASCDGYYLYENRYTLPLGFLVRREVDQTEIVPSSPFLLQNDWIRNACGVSDVFHILNSFGGTQAEFTVDEDGRCLLYIPTDMETCLLEIYRGDEQVANKRFDSLEPPQIIDAGDVEKDDRIVVHSGDQDVTSLTVYPALMDYQAYEEAMEELGKGVMQITEHDDTLIEGTVEVSPGQILFTTIPYDEGWTVYVDGEKTAYRDFKKSFIMVDLEPGTHTVKFIYWPVGLTAGIIISLAALAAFAVWMVLRRRKQMSLARQQKEQMPEHPENQEKNGIL